MNVSTPLCAPTADAAFGSVVDAACCNGFDFTLVFEQSIFVLLPASLRLLAAPLRLVQLRKSSVKVADHVSRMIKLLILVVLWATHDGPARVNSVSVAAACVSFAASVMSCALSYFEHARSLGPSSLLNVFLLASLLLGAAVLRTVWLSLSTAAVNGAAGARGKGKVGHTLAPEETSGLYSRAVFAWVAPLLRTGFRRLLRPEDLFPLDDEMSASGLNERFWWHWRKASPSTRANRHRLILCSAVTLRSALVSAIAPRLALLAFTISQPLVLTRLLGFLDDETQSVNIGYGLLGAYGLVYLGIAVTQALYWHQNGRLVTVLRGILVSAVFSKVTEVSIVAVDDSAALTLMSSDVKITSILIGHVKSIKMSGLSQNLSNTIAALRVQEINASRPFRIVGAVTSSVAQVPLLLSPVLAFCHVSRHYRGDGQKSNVNVTPPRAEYKAKQVEIRDDKRRQRGDAKVYKYYSGSIGFISVVTLFPNSYLTHYVAVWLKFWADSNDRGDYRPGFHLGVCAAFQITGVLWFALLIWFVLVVVAAKSGASLHHRLLSAVIG
ncbi:MRP-type ABC transporter [Trichoderma cornu-damae]|uniref:MRP-type ABC transporter n=1 Tax=Trichoderma cornu-damae TaxID=654480 RepID=A0A9P8QQ08_9HYPO|nr:MRP-type ABC transporter [Trichoderma cornu-damae]